MKNKWVEERNRNNKNKNKNRIMDGENTKKPKKKNIHKINASISAVQIGWQIVWSIKFDLFFCLAVIIDLFTTCNQIYLWLYDKKLN